MRTGAKNALHETVTDPAEIARILGQSSVLFLVIHREPAPYAVPMFFGHEESTLYVHSAPRGAKIDLLRADARVGFTAVAGVRIVEGETACDFSVRSQSVVGSGIARILRDEAEKRHGLDLIMRHYAARGVADGFAYKPSSLSRTSVIAVEIHDIMGRRLGDQTG